MTRQTYFSELLPVLAERSRLAAISRLGFANLPLQRHLSDMFNRPYGEPGAFLADPAFEAVFGWQKSDVSMADLEGSLLAPDLVRAMDSPPTELVQDYRFARRQQPYLHQLEAWRVLAQPNPQSLVVASGTGSGKTECFMVPILDRLARQREEQKGKLIGVRALFLYPLNALINSQRDRLRAWTHAFNGDIRFCLYNGNTPETQPAWAVRDHPNEVLDRKSLRASPPPLLLTNATMLEYMLVRTADSPILAQSQGKLEWVVLDEAHTYVGSQAAEAALLIRRVLFAFGVKPEQVRFVATSATIGDAEGEAGKSLKRFLAEVAGVRLEQVHLVAGQRRVPKLDGERPNSKSTLQKLQEIETDSEVSSHRYDALVQDFTARRLRDLFVGVSTKPPVARLSEICAVLFGEAEHYTAEQQQVALRWLDLVSGTRGTANAEHDEGEAFLPLRAHLFHQTMSGLWACVDQNCPGKRNTSLDQKEWPFGQVFFEPRKHCDCGSPAYEVVSCGGCGTVHLLAGIYKGQVAHLQTEAALDEFELEVEPSEDRGESDETENDGSEVGKQDRVLIVNRMLPHVSALDIQRGSRQISEQSGDTVRTLAHEDGGDGLVCPACGEQETTKNRLLQFSRLGAPFILGGILPTLLEYAPDSDKPADHPCRGRRLLTFNDSRQGTARMAAKLQQDAERNRVRGLVYHLTLQHGQSRASKQVAELTAKKEEIESALTPELPPNARQFLERQLAECCNRIAELSRPVPISFCELAQRLAEQGRDFNYMLAHYRRLAPGTFSEASSPVELAGMFLVREFGRRPKRLNSLETMGLVLVAYPALENIRQVPPVVTQAAGFDLTAWRDFLKICMDFFVRGGGSLAISLAWRSWLGMPFPQSQLVPRDEQHAGRNQRRWPRVKPSGVRSTLVRLLAYVLKADIATSVGEDRIDATLQAAWDALIGAGLLQLTGDGRVLPLNRLAFSPMTQAWICPVTRRLLDTTLLGVTPYLPKHASESTAKARVVQMPLYDEPFGGVTDDLERIARGRNWLMQQEAVSRLRDQGVWSNLNDRVIELAPYFTAAEHSAQQDSRTLENYEKAFKAGDINLLSCSTTMEMGIDIGGISHVAMNNVPPHPANYLQRVGRAGRRGETRSVAMTLCKSNPHDQSVFSDSRWAFVAQLPAPRISLDSPVIVQRHVQSMLLSHFLAELMKNSSQEQTKLTCGLFFLGDNPPASSYAAWCRSLTPSNASSLHDGLRQLLRYSVFENVELSRLSDDAAGAMDNVVRSWKSEWDQLEVEETEIRAGAGENSPAFRAVTIHKARLSEEYLLRELATRGYLPAYGFPTYIASFDNLTLGRLRQQESRGREDNRYRRRELASRDLMTALREYAPGSEVVIDGLVYRSAGVTLNWHVPADQHDVREIQDIRHAWRCNHCGASGSSHSHEAARHCDSCGENVSAEHIREFLKPAGFAVDFYKEPGNDVTSQHFVPVEAPWIDARGGWLPLPNPSLGRFRASVNGHVFHQSRGVHGKGYAICLECGRAEPVSADGIVPSAFQNPHPKLRRARQDGLICPGSADAWKIKTGITLGFETWTDVLEIQIKTETGFWLNDATAAMTLAVALRDALAALIGVQATELGCGIKEARPEPGVRCKTILVFDRFAAGYASSAEKHLGNLFQLARGRLECPVNCDSACPHCVLDFDQRFSADRIDRRAALAVLNDTWINGLKLPNEHAYFGFSSQPEYRPLPEAIWQAVTQQSAEGIRFYVGGTSDSLDIGPSPLRALAYRLAGHGFKVELVLPTQLIDAMNEVDRYLLASLADHPAVVIRAVMCAPRCGQGWLLAETIASPATRWALSDEAASAFGPDWGKCEGALVVTGVGTHLPLDGGPLSAETLRPVRIEAGDREIEIHNELNGNLQGFGKHFWNYISIQHAGTQALLADRSDHVVALRYRDRYLFTPLSIAVLAELVCGLRELVEEVRWDVRSLEIVTMNRRAAGESAIGNRLWSDWPDMSVRDRVLLATFNYLGIDASIRIADSSETGHGRLLEVDWSSGRKLTLRLDQGVSYWRAARSNDRQVCYYELNAGDIEAQARRLAELKLLIEGAQLPTQLFVKVR